jgi:hypothetical protein
MVELIIKIKIQQKIKLKATPINTNYKNLFLPFNQSNLTLIEIK